MLLLFSVKDHKPYSQTPLKDLPNKQRNFHHYLVFLFIFQILLVLAVVSWISFGILPVALKIYIWHGIHFLNDYSNFYWNFKSFLRDLHIGNPLVVNKYNQNNK